MPKRFEGWRTHLLLWGPALVAFGPMIAAGRSLFLRDTGLYFLPHKELIRRALLAGRLPQWNPYEYGGLPLLADPNFNVFHPLSVLTYALPQPLGTTLFMFACALSLVYGGRALAKALGCSEGAAILCGLTLAWCGPSVSLMQTGQAVAGCFVPWLLASAVRAAQAPAPVVAGGVLSRASLPAIVRPILEVSAAAALVLLSGTPEIGACGFVLGALLAVLAPPVAGSEGAAGAADGVGARTGLKLRGLALFAAGCVLGALLAAAQIVPTAAYAELSSRASGFDFAQAVRYSLDPARLWTILLPAGDVLTEGEASYVLELHSGIVVVLLALLSLRSRSARGPRLALLGVALACLVLALGRHTPVFEALWTHLPPLRAIRYPEKLIVPLAWALSVCAAAGWDWLRERVRPHAGGQGAAAPRLALLLPVLASLCALELALPAWTLWDTIPSAELTAPPPLAQAIRALPGSASDFRISSQSSGISADLTDALGEPSWSRPRKLHWLRHRALVDAWTATWGLRSDRGASGFTPGALQRLYQSAPGREVMNLLSVRFGITYGPAQPVYDKLGFVPSALSSMPSAPGTLPSSPGTAPGPTEPLVGPHVRENPSAPPRLRLVSLVRPQGNAPLPPCPLDAIVLSEADQAELPPQLPVARSCAEVPPHASLGTAQLTRDEPEHVAGALEVSRPCLVLLADTFAPGWTATLDGQLMPLVAADGALRAVPVPPGKHTLSLDYRAPGLDLGLVVSALALLGWFTLFALARRPAMAVEASAPGTLRAPAPPR